MRKLTLPLLFLAASACGDDGPGKTNDAGPMDDASVDASNNQPVTLTVSAGGGPRAGVRVHFLNPDSSLIASVDTDSSGVASAVMPDGGYVTAINPFEDAPGGAAAYESVWGYAGVKPGDELVLKDEDRDSAGDLEVTAPIDADGSVTRYLFSTPCDNIVELEAGDDVHTTGLLYLDERCTPNTDLLVASVDDSDEIVHWLFAENVDTSMAVDLSASAITSTPTSKTFTYSNIPSSGGGLQLGVALFSARGQILELGTGDAGTTVEATLKLPAFPNATEFIFGGLGAPYGFHAVGDWGPFSAAAHSVDVGARLLREATGYAEHDAAAKKITWSEAATGAVADFAVAELEARRETPGIYIYWHLLTPAGTAEIQLPTLPVEGTDYNLQETDVVDIYVTLGKVPGGYDGIRESFFALDGPASVTSVSTTGSMALQEVTSQQVLLAPLQKLAQPYLPKKRSALSGWKLRGRALRH